MEEEQQEVVEEVIISCSDWNRLAARPYCTTPPVTTAQTPV